MNTTTGTSTLSDGIWPHKDSAMPVPDTSMLSGAESPSAAAELMGRAVQGAHQNIDRLTDSAAPTVRPLGGGVSSAEEALHATADQLREVRDELSESLRRTVRSSPLTAVALALALALGAVIMRIKR